MSTIRTIYHPNAEGKPQEPNFPASDQHPDAVRYLVGDYYVDALDGEPTPEEVDALLNPPAAEPQPTIADVISILSPEQQSALSSKISVKSTPKESP